MTDSLKLWGRATSYNVQKVAWVIGELGLSCQRIDKGGAFGGLEDPDYIAMNPNKRVPTLADGDRVLWESNAICRYLVAAYATGANLKIQNLKSQTVQDHAQADMWMEWFQSTLYANSIALFYQVVRLPTAQRDEAKRQRLQVELGEALAIFDQALEDRRFILGDQLSLGDIPTGAFLYRYFKMEIARPPLPNLARYYADLAKRPAYQAAVMVDYSALRAGS